MAVKKIQKDLIKRFFSQNFPYLTIGFQMQMTLQNVMLMHHYNLSCILLIPPIMILLPVIMKWMILVIPM